MGMPTKYMPSGWYIIIGGGTIYAGPYNTEMEAEEALSEDIRSSPETEKLNREGAFDIIYAYSIGVSFLNSGVSLNRITSMIISPENKGLAP